MGDAEGADPKFADFFSDSFVKKIKKLEPFFEHFDVKQSKYTLGYVNEFTGDEKFFSFHSEFIRDHENSNLLSTFEKKTFFDDTIF
jgi:hypothetical protein